MEPIAFSVQGIPKAQPRVKAYVRGKHAAVYTPKSADAWKDCIRAEARMVRPEEPITEAVRVCLSFWMPRPKSHFRANGQRKANAPKNHTNRPDIDNLTKAVLDVLSELGFWRDDSLVSSLSVWKQYACDTDTGCSITIRPLFDEGDDDAL